MSQPATKSIDISVVIAAYEAADFIETAIRACLRQEGVSVEIIIVDDCSPSPLEPVVAKVSESDPRVHYIRLPENQGPAGARNAAFDRARGEYIAILDADDDMRPDRLQKLLTLAREHKADLVVDNLIEVYHDETGREETCFLDFEADTKPFWINLETYMSSGFTPRFKRPLGYLKPLFRRSFVEAGEYRYDTNLKNSEDHYLVAEMLAHGAKMLMTPDAGYYYVRHEASLSYRLSADQAVAIVRAEKEFLQRHASTLSPAEKKISILRQRALKNTASFEAVAGALKARAFMRAFGLILSDPVTAPAHVWRLMSIGLRKLA